MDVKVYKQSKWHWLLHTRNGDPSTFRAIGVIGTFACTLIATICAIYGQATGAINMAALFH